MTSKVPPTVQIQGLIDELEGAMLPDNQRLRGDANRWLSYIRGRLKEIKNDLLVQLQAENPNETSPE